MSDLRTPEEWCALRGVRILDPDGWRSADAPAWDEPISEDEFKRRLWICTIENTPTLTEYLGGDA